MGFALCAFFRINRYGYSSERYSLNGCVITPGGKPQHTFEFFIGETSLNYSVGHLWLLYLSRDEWLATHGDDQCSQIEVVFDTNSPSMVVIKCAVRLIYEQDVEVFNKTIGTYDDNNVTETSASRRFSEGTERGNDHITHPSCYKSCFILLYFLSCAPVVRNSELIQIEGTKKGR